EEVMAEQGLGPNGAQVAAADMAAMNAKELADVLETFETNYNLIDTPGQIELFTFRASGPVLIDAFGREESALIYLNDPALVKSPSGFISSVLTFGFEEIYSQVQLTFEGGEDLSKD